MPNKKKKDNIRQSIEKEWPSAKAFGTILPNYMITPDSTFTRQKTGAGDIEYFNEPSINYGSEDSPNIILNPNGNIPTLLYSPQNNSLDDVKLDLLHHYRQYDPVYQDLLKDYTSTQNKSEILWNSQLGDQFRNKYPDTYNKHWKEWDALVNSTPDNSQYMVQGIDGSLRNLLAKEETIKKSNYAPREEAIQQYLNTPKAQQAFNNIQQYLESSRLPEVIVTPNSHDNGGSLKSPLDWNELSMKEKAAYIRMGVANGYKDIDSIKEVYNEFKCGGNLYKEGGPKKQEYIYNVLPRLLKEAGLNIRVTSGYRKPGAVGTAGNRSWHPRHGAVDIVPMGKTTFEDIEEVLHTNPTIVKYMLDNGFGLLDESGRSQASKDTMKRTGATGAHFHIGRDSKPAALYKQRVVQYSPMATTDNRKVYFSNPHLPIPEDQPQPKQVVSIQTPAKPLLNTTLDSNIPTDQAVMQQEEPIVDRQIPEVVVTAQASRQYVMPNPQELLDQMNSMMVPYKLPEIPKPVTATERLAQLNQDKNSLLQQDLENSILRASRFGTPLDEVKLAKDIKDLQFYRNMSADGGNLFQKGGPLVDTANAHIYDGTTEGSQQMNDNYIYTARPSQYDFQVTAKAPTVYWDGFNWIGFNDLGQRETKGSNFNPSGAKVIENPQEFENARLVQARRKDINGTHRFAEDIRNFTTDLVMMPTGDVIAEPLGIIGKNVVKMATKPVERYNLVDKAITAGRNIWSKITEPYYINKIHGKNLLGNWNENVATGVSDDIQQFMIDNVVNRNVRELQNAGKKIYAQNYADRAQNLMQNAKVGQYSQRDYTKAGWDNVSGLYDGDNFISLNKDLSNVDNTYKHETHHLLDRHNNLLESQQKLLNKAYDETFENLTFNRGEEILSKEALRDEKLTLNSDARNLIVGKETDLAKQDALIDTTSDEDIFKAIRKSGEYGRRFINYLRKHDGLTPEKASYFREAMKHVGGYIIPAVIGGSTLYEATNN